MVFPDPSDGPDKKYLVIPENIPAITDAAMPAGLPKTGDESSSLLAFSFILSLLGIAILMLAEKKEKETEDVLAETGVSTNNAKAASSKAVGNNMCSFGMTDIRGRKAGAAGLSCMLVR